MSEQGATLAVRNPRTGQVDHQITVATQAEVAAKAATLRANQVAWEALGIGGRCAVMARWLGAQVRFPVRIVVVPPKPARDRVAVVVANIALDAADLALCLRLVVALDLKGARVPKVVNLWESRTLWIKKGALDNLVTVVEELARKAVLQGNVIGGKGLRLKLRDKGLELCH